MGVAASMSVPKKKWLTDLYQEISNDNVFNGAAALAYYLLLALFPALIFLLSLIPYLPIENLHQAVMDALRQAMPGDAVKMVEGVVSEVTRNKSGGLLSFGALATIWAASSGLYAIMQQLNITYDVKESRPFWKVRGTAVLLTILFGILIVGAFSLIVFGGVLQSWLGDQLGMSAPLLIFFAIFRWVVIALLLLGAFSLTYYYGPDVEQKFTFITPGAVMGVVILAVASLAFRFYVENFGDYAATYGSIGAVIILMLWLYIAGLVILLGSEINALAEHYAPDGKNKGERKEPAHGERPKNALGHKAWKWSKYDKPQQGRPAPVFQPGLQPSYAASKMRFVDLGLALVAFGLAARKERA